MNSANLISSQMIGRNRFETEPSAPQREVVPIALTGAGLTNVTLYTVPSDRFFNVKQFDVCPLAAAVAVTVHVVPSGGTAGDATKIYDDKSLMDTTTLTSMAGVIPAGSSVVVSTDSATGANFRMWGYLTSGGDAEP